MSGVFAVVLTCPFLIVTGLGFVAGYVKGWNDCVEKRARITTAATEGETE